MTSRAHLTAVIQSESKTTLSKDVWRMSGPVLDITGKQSTEREVLFLIVSLRLQLRTVKHVQLRTMC